MHRGRLVVALLTAAGLIAGIGTATASGSSQPIASASSTDTTTVPLNTGPGATAPSGDPLQPPAAPSASLAEQQRFRLEFGLDSSLAAINAASTWDLSGNPYGIPLTPSELADMTQRFDEQNNQGSFVQLANSMQDRIGGIWKDQQAHGQFVIVALPGLSPSDQASLIAALPTGATYRFESGTVSQATIYGWIDTLTKSLMLKSPRNSLSDLLDSYGLTVSTIQPDTRANRLVVYLTALPADSASFYTAWDQAVAEGIAPSRSFTDFRVRPQYQNSESRTDSPGQMKSGLQVKDAAQSCTSNLDGRDGSGHTYLLTAGHCFYIGDSVKNGVNTVLGSFNSAYATGSDSDGGTVGLTTKGLASQYAYAHRSGKSPELDTISSLKSNALFLPGDQTCGGGIATDIVICGTVLEVHVPIDTAASRYYPAVTLENQYDTDLPMTFGDSGGLGGVGPVGQGVASSSIPGVAESYSFLDLVFLHFGLYPLIGPNNTPITWATVRSEFATANCMDVSGNSSTNGTQVWAWGCNGNPAQQWSFIAAPGQPAGTYNISRYAVPSKCLDADSAHPGNGEKVQEWTCNNLRQQQWVINRFGPSSRDVNFLNLLTGYCLDLNIGWPGGGYAQGTPLQIYQCLGHGTTYQMNQEWFLDGGGP
jgi:hypothetical protein